MHGPQGEVRTIIRGDGTFLDIRNPVCVHECGEPDEAGYVADCSLNG